MMLKKTIIAIAMSAITMGSIAAHAAPYVGVGTGIVNNTNTVTANGSSFTGGAYRGMPLNLSLGYGSLMGQNVYLAGELTGTVGTADISSNTQLKTSYGYGVSVIPGLLLSDRVMTFLRLGAVESRFSNSNDWRTGGQVGLGSQIALTQQLDVRGEYDFVAYESKNQTAGSVSSSVAPRSDQFNLGLVYRFE